MTWKPKAGRRGRSSVTQRLKTKSQQPQLVWQGTSGAAPPLLPALHCCHLWDGLNVKPVSLAASGWWRIKPHPSERRQPHSSLQISSFVKALLENHGFFTQNKQGYDRRSNCCRRSGENVDSILKRLQKELELKPWTCSLTSMNISSKQRPTYTDSSSPVRVLAHTLPFLSLFLLHSTLFLFRDYSTLLLSPKGHWGGAVGMCRLSLIFEAVWVIHQWHGSLHMKL